MATTTTPSKGSIWEGGKPGMKASWGKLMMWFFLVSDAFTFSAFLISYGVARFSSKVEWANPEEVFTHFPGLYEWFHFESPLTFVGLMTFILIASSVTMVLAVEAGHRLDKKAVEKWMIWTIIGGIAFLGCQAYEWFHFIHGVNPEGVLRHNVIDARGVMHDSALIRGAGMRYNEYTANPFVCKLLLLCYWLPWEPRCEWSYFEYTGLFCRKKRELCP